MLEQKVTVRPATKAYRLRVWLIALFAAVLSAAPLQTFGQQAAYSYDENGRLAAVAFDNGVSISYLYDDNGNLLQRQISVVEPSGSLQFSMSTLAVNEDSGDIIINVQRVGGTNNPVSVEFATADQSATAGSDYVANSGTLNWASGDNGDRIITLVPIADPDGEPDETFSLALSNPAGGAELGTITTLIITLLDDDERFFADGFEG